MFKFDDAGSKIKSWAKVFFYLFALSSVAGCVAILLICPNGHYIITLVDAALAAGVLVIGCLLSWFGALMIYAFGENNENLKIIASGKTVEGQSDQNSAHAANFSGSARSNKKKGNDVRIETWVCKMCGEVNPRSKGFCQGCGMTK